MSSMTLSPDTHVARPRVVRPRPASDSARPAARVAARPGPRGEMRLTRRGRFVLFVAALLLVLGAALFLGATSVATNDAGTCLLYTSPSPRDS